jgi:hypothetical protein
MYRFVALCFASVVFLAAAPAAAQVYAGDDGDGTQPLYSISTTTTTTAIGVAMIVATVATVMSDNESAHLERYLRNNAVALEGDLAFGAGDTIDDLAAVFRVPEMERARFGRALREHAGALMELADPARLDTFRAKQFALLARRAWQQSRGESPTA